MPQETTDEIAREIAALGDPSGHQDAAYWDRWFEIVGRDRDIFEWYCGADEVVRVLHHYIKNESQGDDKSVMIHPGAGTSLVPLLLQDHYPHRHLLVDVSQVAVEGMKRYHDSHAATGTHADCISSRIAYQVVDLLQPQLPFPDNVFAAWLDKGFLDAVFSFSVKHWERNQVQCRSMFQETCRVLQPGGIMMIITLAEHHSLRLILDGWLAATLPNGPCWQSTLNIWELTASSGELPPFAFVLRKANSTTRVGESHRVVWHPQSCPVEEIAACGSERTLKDAVLQRVGQARVANLDMIVSRTQAVRTNPERRRRILATLEVKTYDAGDDLAALGRFITSNESWMAAYDHMSTPQWQEEDSDSASGSAKFSIEPVGYGIQKLVLKCVVDENALDDLKAALEELEWSANEGFEGIQSVDIDWLKVAPIGDVRNIIRK